MDSRQGSLIGTECLWPSAGSPITSALSAERVSPLRFEYQEIQYYLISSPWRICGNVLQPGTESAAAARGGRARAREHLPS